MLGILLIAVFGAWAIMKRQTITEVATDLPLKISEKLERLWDVAQESLRDKKYLRAEKALLTILRVDERNATAYNRLGILYAKQKEYRDAIDCFEIASSIESTPSSLHNLGLIYYETENYEKAAVAFEQALKLEDNLAARHVANAKVQEKLGNLTHRFAAPLRIAISDDVLQPGNERFRLSHQKILNTTIRKGWGTLDGVDEGTVSPQDWATAGCRNIAGQPLRPCRGSGKGLYRPQLIRFSYDRV